MTKGTGTRPRLVDHGLRPETWKDAFDRLTPDEEAQVSNELSSPTHGVLKDQLATAAAETSRTLAWYRHQTRHPSPTPAAERDAVKAYIERAKALRQAWDYLPHITKCTLGAADYEAFDEFDGKLDDVQGRAYELLRVLLEREEINTELQTLERHERTRREFMGKPRYHARREALKGLCVAWLLYTETGQKSLATGEWLHGAREEAATFTDLLLQLLSKDVPSDSNRRLLSELYAEAMTEAKEKQASRTGDVDAPH